MSDTFTDRKGLIGAFLSGWRLGDRRKDVKMLRCLSSCPCVTGQENAMAEAYCDHGPCDPDCGCGCSSIPTHGPLGPDAKRAIKDRDWVLVTQVARDVENGVPSQLAADLLFWLADFLEPRAEPKGGYKYGTSDE